MVAYHKVCESVATGAARFAQEPGAVNLSDALTEFLPKPVFQNCCYCMMYH